MNIIEVKNISKKYGDITVLDNITINFKKGKISLHIRSENLSTANVEVMLN